jgi:ADP-heptose:LPS heptosyltransferase
LAIALGGAVTAGHFDSICPDGLDVAVPWPDGLPEVERNLRLVAAFGCPVDDTSLVFPLDDSDRDEAERLLSGLPAGRPLIGVHPGARHPSRHWPPERFAAVADALAMRLNGLVVVTGGPDELTQAEHVASLMSEPAIVLAGRTSLGGLAAIIERAAMFISNDTGPAHIATALETPSVVLFGPADLARWAPRGKRQRVLWRDVSCRPCGLTICPIDHRCLRWIETDEVITAASEVLGAPALVDARAVAFEPAAIGV